MGRLINKRLASLVRIWSVPLLIAAMIIGGSHFMLISAAPTSQEILDYLNNGNTLQVEVEEVNGFYQVYFLFDSEKVFITDVPRHHSDPVTSDEYIVYVGQVNSSYQIYQYNALTGTTIQLSNYSTNLNPKAYQDWVVWEHWEDEQWEVFFYDGSSVSEISDPLNGSAARPIVQSDQIRYTQESAGTYTIRNYVPSTGITTTVTSGAESVAAWPSF